MNGTRTQSGSFWSDQNRSFGLVMAGDVALNCVANGKLLCEKVFDHLWI